MNFKIIAFVFMLLMAVPYARSVQERLIVVNEGNWQSDSGKLSYFEDGRIVSNQWFRDKNGSKLGDTPCDIIAVNDDLIAIAVNWSNIIQFIGTDGKAVAATEDVPNNRKLATDGRYVYVTSYAHECLVGGKYVEFEKGFTAKIDVSTFKTVAACEVGYEPEGIAWYNGYLFVANSGGYAFQEDHEYETTVSIIDTSDMSLVRTVDTGIINLYGKMSQSGRYLCINSPGDYYENEAACVIFDCEAALEGASDDACCVALPLAATYSCTAADGRFYAIGSRYSYFTGDYETNYVVIDPQKVMATYGTSGVTDDFPGRVANDLKALGMPYGIYVNPYTGYVYATDAGSFVEGGSLHQWSADGKKLGKYGVYINPGHFLALKPDNYDSADVTVADDACDDVVVYNLQGIRVSNPLPGNIYICSGKKTIFK